LFAPVLADMIGKLLTGESYDQQIQDFDPKRFGKTRPVAAPV
jgi:hypothetical protein